MFRQKNTTTPHYEFNGSSTSQISRDSVYHHFFYLTGAHKHVGAGETFRRQMLFLAVLVSVLGHFYHILFGDTLV